MKKLVFLCCLFLSQGLLALELYAEKKDDSVLVYLLNNSNFDDVAVNRRFSYGDPRSLREIAFYFTDHTGKYVDYSPKHSYSKEEFIILSPSETVGKSFILDSLIFRMGVPPGKYQLFIQYKNHITEVANAFVGILEADPIAIEVTKAQSEGKGRNILHNGVWTRDGIKREYRPLIDHPRR